MTYGLSSFTQISNFLSAAGLGLIICILYYTVSLIRAAVSEKAGAYIISDTLFSVLAAFLLFVFFQAYTYGEIRIELIASSAVSFFVFRYCFRNLFASPYRKGIHILSLFFRALFAPITAPAFFIRKFLKKILKKEK